MQLRRCCADAAQTFADGFQWLRLPHLHREATSRVNERAGARCGGRLQVCGGNSWVEQHKAVLVPQWQKVGVNVIHVIQQALVYKASV